MAAPYGPSPFGGPGAGSAGALSAQAAENARSLRSWMKFFGIVQIVFGGLYCLTIVGIIVGWLPILLGYWIVKAGNGMGDYADTGQISSLETGIGALRAHYITLGILTIISIVMMILWFVMYLILGVAMFAGLASGAGGP